MQCCEVAGTHSGRASMAPRGGQLMFHILLPLSSGSQELLVLQVISTHKE